MDYRSQNESVLQVPSPVARIYNRTHHAMGVHRISFFELWEGQDKFRENYFEDSQTKNWRPKKAHQLSNFLSATFTQPHGNHVPLWVYTNLYFYSVCMTEDLPTWERSFQNRIKILHRNWYPFGVQCTAPCEMKSCICRPQPTLRTPIHFICQSQSPCNCCALISRWGTWVIKT